MKLTFAWNVWNIYDDVLLGSEIVDGLNRQAKLFEETHMISLGGYPEPPSVEQSQFLAEHVHVECPEVPLLNVHVKYRGVYRVLKGIQVAYEKARENGSDYALVTNADAWYLSLENLKVILDSREVRDAEMSFRVGVLSGFDLNYGARAPMFDDHFIIINVKECEASGVFDYDDTARFYYPHFGVIGGIHNILFCFAEQRIKKLHIYSYLDTAIGQYGDLVGWNLLPWQYERATGFLHANCFQVPSLHEYRATFLKYKGLADFENTRKYVDLHASSEEKGFLVKDGDLVRKRSLGRKLKDTLLVGSRRASCEFELGLRQIGLAGCDSSGFVENNKRIVPTTVMN